MANITNARDLALQATSPRVIITTSSISSTSSVFTSLKNAGGVSPASITLTTTAVGFIAPVYTWSYALNSAPNAWSALASTAAITISSTEFAGYIGVASAVMYKCVVSQAGFISATSTYNISYAKEANDGGQGNTMFTLELYSNSTSTPPANNAVSYKLSDNTISGNGNWLLSMPTATSNPTYRTSALISTSTPTVALTVPSWTSAVVVSTLGTQGNSSYTATVYLQQASDPGSPVATSSSYNFNTNVLTPPTGWVVLQPGTTTTPTWACEYTFSGPPTSIVFGTNSWSATRIDAVTGSNGASGSSIAVVEMYKAGGGALPTGTTYTFSTGIVTGTLNGWTQSQPAVSTTATYMTTCRFTALASVDTHVNSAWSAQVVVAQQGVSGAAGISNHRVYIAGLINSTPGTPSTTTSGATPAGWSASPVTLTNGYVMYQSDGSTPSGSSVTSWQVPYPSYLKIGNLEALGVSTGSLSVDGRLTLGVGGNIATTGGSYGGPGIFMGYHAASGTNRVSIGNGTASSSLLFDGTQLQVPAITISGKVQPIQIDADASWKNENVGAGNMLWGVQNGPISVGPGVYGTNVAYIKNDTYNPYGIKAGDVLTISVDLSADAAAINAVGGSQYAQIYLYLQKSNGDWTYSAAPTHGTSTPTRVYSSVTVPATSTDFFNIVVGVYHQGNNASAAPQGTVTADRIQVQRGGMTLYIPGAQPGATANQSDAAALQAAANAVQARMDANQIISAARLDGVITTTEQKAIDVAVLKANKAQEEATAAGASVSLINHANVTVSGNIVTKTSGGATWDAGAYSKDSYTGGAYVSWIPGTAGTSTGAGLNTDPLTNVSYNTVDFWLYCDSSGYLEPYHNGTAQGNLGPWVAGDVLAVTYDGLTVRYLRNGTVLWSFAVVVTAPLFAEISISSPGAKITNVQFGPMSSLKLAADDAKAKADVAATTSTWVGTTGTGKPASYATVGKSLGLPFESWNLSSQVIVDLTDGKVGSKALRLSSGGGYPNQGNYIPIDSSKTYRTRFWARPVTANGVLYFSLRQFINDTGTTGPSNGGRAPYQPENISRAAHNATFGGTDQWGEYKALWSTANWQSGVKFVQPDFLDNYAGNSGYWEIQDFTFEEVTEVLAASTTSYWSGVSNNDGNRPANGATANQSDAKTNGDIAFAGTTSTWSGTTGAGKPVDYATAGAADAATSFGFNPQFSAWTSTYPNGWGGWSGPFPAKETSYIRTAPYSVRFSVSGETGMAAAVAFPDTPTPANTFVSGAYDVYVISNAGGTGKPGILVRLFTNAAQTTFSDTTVPAGRNDVNGWQRMPFSARVASGERIYGVQIYVMAAWSGMPGGLWSNGSTVCFDNLTFDMRDGTTDASIITLGGLGFTGATNANYTTNTNQLIDGSNLGGTANWTGVSSKPSDSELLNSYVSIGKNLIPNSDQTLTITMGYGVQSNAATFNPLSPHLRYASEAWGYDSYAMAGKTRNIYCYQSNNAGIGSYGAVLDIYPFGAWSTELSIPVVPGQRVCISAYLQSHRCYVGVALRFFNSQGGQITNKDADATTTPYGGAKELNQYIRVHYAEVAPTDAALARPYIRKFNTWDGATESYMWIAAPQLEIVAANAGPSPYNSGPPSTVGQLGYKGTMDATTNQSDSTTNNAIGNAGTTSYWSGVSNNDGNRPANGATQNQSDATTNNAIGVAGTTSTWTGTSSKPSNINSLVGTESILNNRDGFISAPEGGYRASTVSVETGAIRVRLPQLSSATMIKMFVDIYEYDAGYSCTLEIAGYINSDANWYNVTARVVGSSNVEYPVRYGNDGSRACIWIGESNTSWSYPQINVRDVLIGYTNYAASQWQRGWEISITPSITNISATVADTLPGADWTKIPNRSGKPADYATVGASFGTGAVAANIIGQILDSNVDTYIGPGAIKTDKLAANSVTTGKLLVTGRGKALNDDPACSDMSAWGMGAGSASVISSADTPSGTSFIRMYNGSQINSRAFPVSAGTRYKSSVWIRHASGGGSLYLRLLCYNSSGGQVSYAVYSEDLGGDIEGRGYGAGWTKFSGYTTIGGGANHAVLQIHCNWNETGITDICDFRTEEYIGADLIVDGAITARKLDITGGSTGARVSITTNRLVVYDSSGAIRVKLGYLG